jgi:hypothetical protein
MLVLRPGFAHALAVAGDEHYERLLRKSIAAELSQHGTLLPPWLKYPDVHRYSIFWRMGVGESYIIMFRAWAKGRSREAWIAYLQPYVPLPLPWVDWAAALVDPDGDDDPERGAARLAEAGLLDLKCWHGWRESNERAT